jgi:hypothetical protein
VNNSYNIHPNEYISTLKSYFSPFSNSGAKYLYFPTILYKYLLLVSNILETPKSPIFISLFSLIIILSGVKSL